MFFYNPCVRKWGLLLPPPDNSFHRPRGGPPPSRREVWGLHALSRSLLYNPGCRVATLLVSNGVMGFLGDLRGRNSKSPPNPLGLAERVYSFHRLRGGPPPSRREVFGVENRRSVEYRREIATVRCVCNAGLHHCNGQMYLQPSVAPPSPVGARIARPFIPDVIMTLRAGARRVIGATAKPLYPIDGKAEGLDRRTPKTSLFEGGGPPRGRWKE